MNDCNMRTATSRELCLAIGPALAICTIGPPVVDSVVQQTPPAPAVEPPPTEVSPSPPALDGDGVPDEADLCPAQYFDLQEFTKLQKTRLDSTGDSGWGTGFPDTSVGADTFSIRWTGLVLTDVTGAFTFSPPATTGIDSGSMVSPWLRTGRPTR